LRFGVVVFPGSNCDHDAWYALSHNLGHSAEFIWHDSASLGPVDAVILPGGFSWRLFALRRHREVFAGDGSGEELRGRGRAGAGNLQRISGVGGERVAAGR